MKRFSLLFLSLFIIGLIYPPVSVANTIHSIGTIPGTVSTAGVATGGGLWSATTTWLEGTVPTASDTVIIVTGDLVVGGGNASSLTVQTGAKISQTASVTCTTGGTFTLESGSWWYASYSSATKMPQGFGTYNIDPASNWVFTTAASSSLINLPPSAGPVIYGNAFVYKTGAVLAAATSITNINIQGNLTINFASSTLKLTNNKSPQSTTIHVGGNINIISGVLSGVDVAADWSLANSDPQSCIVNVDGNVNVGDGSTASGAAGLTSVSSADGGFKRSATFNIYGDLNYVNGAKFEAGTSSSSTRTDELCIINLYGNLTTDASVIIAANTLGTFQINFVGSSTKSITLGAPTTQMLFSCTTILGINKTAGDVQLLSPVTIGGHVTLTLTNGSLITTSTNIPTISGSGAISNGSSTSFVNGPLSYNNVSTSPKSFVYPLSKGSVYRPLTLSLTQSDVTPSIYTAEMFNSTPVSNAFPGTLDKVSSARYYIISENGGGSAFTAGSVLLNYDSDDGVSDKDNVRIAQGPVAGGGTWVDLGGIGTASTTGTITSAVTDLSTNTVFTLANNTGGSNALPVELSSFTAFNKERTIQLNWVTQTEKNSNKFEIERSSIVNRNWVIVGVVQASGTISIPSKYSYTEKNLQAGKYQYRLKMIDNDGSYKYSNLVETDVALPKNFALSQNYPNPFNPTTKIDYQVPVDSKVILEVYNIAGQKVIELVNRDQSAGYYTTDFGSSKLSTGVYIYRIVASDKATGNNFSSIKKMILLK